MRRGYLDMTAEFVRDVDIGQLMPRAWRLVGSALSPIPDVIRLIYQNDDLPDGPTAKISVVKTDDGMSQSIHVIMKDADAWDVRAPGRFFLAHDDSGHRYVVPVERRDEWEAWQEDRETDEAPDYARRVEGGLTFTDPRD